MKRKALLLLIIILISSILSCCDNRKTVIDDTVYDRECEVQNKYIEQPNAGFYVQEVGNSYIGTTELNRSLISYYDSENGISGVLCSDPSCTHDTNSCSARNHSGSVFYYDHQIYSIAQDSGSNTGNYILWKEDVSGNNRKKVKEIDLTDIWNEYVPQQLFLHHGKLYMLGKANTVEGARPEYRISLLSTPIDGNNDYQTLVDKRVSTAVWAMARFVGNHVYYMTDEYSLDERTSSITVMRFSTADGKEEIVYKEQSKTETFFSFWVTDEEEIYIAGNDEDNRACIWKIKENRRKKTITWETIDKSDPHLMDGIAVLTYMVDGTRCISIKDFENKTLYDGPLFVESPEGVNEDLTAEIYYGFVGGDKEKIIVDVHTARGRNDYTILLDINNDLEPTLLWSS